MGWVGKDECGNICLSHGNKISVVTDLLNKFPWLLNVKGISFTQLYNFRKKVVELFTDEDIANKWSEKMIYQDELCTICYENPREPSVFSPCGHGQDYCNTCMTESLKSRETIADYQLDDGKIEYHTKQIPCKTCPVCRKRNCRMQLMYWGIYNVCWTIEYLAYTTQVSFIPPYLVVHVDDTR